MTSPTYAVRYEQGRHLVVEQWSAFAGFAARESVVFTGMDESQAETVATSLNGWSERGAMEAAIESLLEVAR